MDHEDIKAILNKPLLQKLQDMQAGLQNNLDAIYVNSEIMAERANATEYARANGQIWGLQFAKGMLDAILRLEEKRQLWEQGKESAISE